MPVRDIRTPADPQDFETLYDRAAIPPADFRVTKDAGSSLVIFHFKDWPAVPERTPTVEFRAYFLPATIATQTELGRLPVRLAAVRMGQLAASVPTTGRGGWSTVSSPYFAGRAGYYVAVGVNRRGVESEPTLAFKGPY